MPAVDEIGCTRLVHPWCTRASAFESGAHGIWHPLTPPAKLCDPRRYHDVAGQLIAGVIRDGVEEGGHGVIVPLGSRMRALSR